MKKKLIISLITFSLSSCALYKDEYTTPQFKDLNNQIESGANTSYIQNKWWTSFGDAKLNNLIESVMSQNTNLAVALANVQSSKASLAQARYSWLPTASMGLSNQQSNGINSSVNPMANSNTGYTASFVPSYNLNTMQTIFNNQLAEVNLDATQASLDNVKLMLIGQTIGSYYTYNQLRSQQAMQQQLVAQTQAYAKLTQQQVKEGFASQVTLQTVLAQLALTKSQLELTNTSVIQARNSIKLLVNNLSNQDYTMAQDFNSFSYTLNLPESISSSVLNQRPDVRIAEANLKAANINVAIARAVFFPTISLTATVGSVSQAFSELFTSGTDFWITQAAANVPVLNMGSYEQIQANKGQYYASYYTYMQVVKTAFLSTYNDLANYNSYKNIASNYQDYLASSKSVYNLNRAGYNEGLNSKMQYMSANINYLNAQIAYSATKLATLSSIISLYQDFGAGYSSFEPQLKKVHND